MVISALVGLGAAAGAVILGVSSAAAVIAIGVGAAAVMNYTLDSMGEDAAVDTMSGRTVTNKSTQASRRIVYGTTRIGGVLAYQANSGTDNKYLHNVVVFCEGEVDKVEKIYMNDTLAMKGVDGNVRYVNDYSDNEDGSVSNVGKNFYTQVRRGTLENQPLPSGKDVPAQALTDAKWSKLCYAYVRLEYDADQYDSGVPNISALIRGKHIYDPRKDSTSALYDSSLGVNNMRLDAPNTWDYSTNPALCLLDYMLDSKIGMNEDYSNFDEDSLLAAINCCDEQVTYNGTPYVRYACNGVIDSAQSHKNNIKQILSSMGGKLVYAAGKYHIKPAKYYAPHSEVVTEDKLLGGLEVTTKIGMKSLYNRVKGKHIYVGTGEDFAPYTPRDFQVRQSDQANPSWEEEDGEVIYKDITLPMTTGHFHAVRLADIVLKKSRMQATCKFKIGASGLLYTVGDNIKITDPTFGYNEKVFEVLSQQIMIDSEKGIVVTIEARENNSDVYDPNTTSIAEIDSETVDLITSVNLNKPTNLTIVPDVFFGNQSLSHAVRYSFDSDQSAYIERYEIEEYEVNAMKHARKIISTEATEGVITGLDNDRDYQFKVRAVSHRGTKSAYSTAVEIRTPKEQYNGFNIEFIETSDSSMPEPTIAEAEAALGRGIRSGDKIYVIYVVDNEAVDSKLYIFKQELSHAIHMPSVSTYDRTDGGDAVLSYDFELDLDLGTPTWTATTDAGFQTSLSGVTEFAITITPTGNTKANVAVTLTDAQHTADGKNVNYMIGSVTVQVVAGGTTRSASVPFQVVTRDP